MRAPVTNFDVDDVRAMYLESKQKDKRQTAAQLYASIPDFVPTESEGIIRPALASEIQWPTQDMDALPYTYKVTSLSELDALPMMQWDVILALFKQSMDA